MTAFWKFLQLKEFTRYFDNRQPKLLFKLALSGGGDNDSHLVVQGLV